MTNSVKTVIPAQPGFYVLTEVEHSSGYKTTDKHPVVAWVVYNDGSTVRPLTTLDVGTTDVILLPTGCVESRFKDTVYNSLADYEEVLNTR